MNTATHAARCHDTGKLRIGIAHIPAPRPIHERDAITLQSALLEPRTARPQSRIQQLLGGLWKWL